MKKFIDFLFIIFTAGEFFMIGWILSKFDIKVGVVCGVIGIAYQLISNKQTEIENKLFEIKELIK